MKVVKRYKTDSEETEDNKRCYVVPETVSEANDIVSYGHRVVGSSGKRKAIVPSEPWPCKVLTQRGLKKGEKHIQVEVFRFHTTRKESELISHVNKCLEAAAKRGKRNKLAISGDATDQLIYSSKYIRNQW